MGSEDSIPISDQGSHSNLPAFTDKASSKITTNNDYELLIAIRGQRNTGKTSLIQRMQGKPFVSEYTPTKMLSAAEFIWKSPKKEKVRITAWDVVEHALLPDDIQEKIEYPDATTVDTYKRTDGIVIMIDSRYQDTIKLAENILKNAPAQIPIVVFSNFQDSNDAVPTIPKLIKKYIDRFSFIVGSMKSNLGLTDLSEWITLPLAKSKSNLYLNKYHSLMDELNRKIIDFTTTAEYYVDPETAKKRLPKPTSIGHSQNNTQNNSHPQQNQNQGTSQRRPSEIIAAKDENDFWSDDDEDAINKRIQQKIDNNKLSKKDEKEEENEVFVANPMVKRRVVKKSSDQNLPTQNKQENAPENKPKQNQSRQQPQIKPDLIKIEGNVDDDFFNDDEDEDQHIPENVNLKVLEEEDEEPLRPNPLVESIKSKKPANRQVQAKNQSKEETTANKIKAEPEKKETKEKENQTKPTIPTIKVENEGNNEDNGFFDDDDEDESKLEEKIVLPNNDSDDEELKPNPLVSSKTVPRIAPKVVKPSITTKTSTEEQNKVENDNNNNTEKDTKENPVSIPTIKTEDLGGNEDEGFFDDDDNETIDNDTKIDTINNEEEEQLKPNPLVASKPAPKSSTPPPPPASTTTTTTETTLTTETTENPPKQEENPVSIPTIDAADLGGNENEGFFDEEDNEGDENDTKIAAPNNNNDEDEEQLKPNPLIASKPAPKSSTPPPPQTIPESTEDEHKEKEESQQQQPSQVSIPTIDAGEVDNDFFNDDDNNEAEKENETQNQEKAESPSQINTNVSSSLPTTNEKVDDSFFDDEDEDKNNNTENINNQDDDEDEPVIKPNPLVASNIKSKLQDSIVKQSKDLHQQEDEKQPQSSPNQNSPSIPTVTENADVDDFFNDNDDNEEPAQNRELEVSNSSEYADIAGSGYDEMSNETENSSSSSTKTKKKPRKKVVKRKKHQSEQSEPSQPPPEVSGDYESI